MGILTEGILLLGPAGIFGGLGAFRDAVDPMYGFTPMLSCAISSVWLFSYLAMISLGTLGFVYLTRGPIALRKCSRVAWWLSFMGIGITIAAALSTWVLPPSIEYSEMYWFRESLRAYTLGSFLLVPFLHLVWLACFQVQKPRQSAVSPKSVVSPS